MTDACRRVGAAGTYEHSELVTCAKPLGSRVYMISIQFFPIFEDKKITDAVNEYQAIWNKEGARIVETLQRLAGLSFLEDHISVVIYEGTSFSGRTIDDVMKLRASYNTDVKKGTIIHELSHRLLFNLKNVPDIDSHKIINLFLYDVWVDLYGEDFATQMVEVEKKRAENYIIAWNEVLALTREQRAEKFLEYLK